MDSVGGRLRLRLLPALLTAMGVVLLTSGVVSYATPVQSPPVTQALASYAPLPTVAANLTLPSSGASAGAPTFPPDRVATRIVIPRLNIDLPVMLQTDNYGVYPLCDVALYQPVMGQPGEGRATYIYAHARSGMFLPLLTASQTKNGASLIGVTVEVYTSDDWRFLYTISEVHRHTLSLSDALNTHTERLYMQTSEGPQGTVPKLQVVADYLSSAKTDAVAAHPPAHPRICG